MLRLMSGLTGVPVSYYDERWDKLFCFGDVPEAGETGAGSVTDSVIHREMLSRLKDMFPGKAKVWMPYDEDVPIALYGVAVQGGYVVFGPFSFGKVSGLKARSYMRKYGIGECPACQMGDVKLMADFFRSDMTPRGEDVLTEDKERSTFGEEQAGSSDDMTKDSVGERCRQSDAFEKNHTYAQERPIYEWIRRGEPQELRRYMKDTVLHHPMIIADVKKNEEYMAVIAISMAARAAIDGGIDSEEGFLKNDLFLQKLSGCRSVDEIDRLRRESQMYFAALVRENRERNSGNHYVEECKRYISANRFRKVEIGKLASRLGVSCGYLRRLFASCEGVTLHRYMTRIKIETACELLACTDRKIQDISDELGYSGVSYFSASFRRETGMSPLRYREKYYRSRL